MAARAGRLAALLSLAMWPAAATTQDPPAWTRPAAPVHLVGPIWYVGSQGLAAYLIRTSAGAILIDATMAENVPAIVRNVEQVGVPIRQVKWLLLTHAHFDHAAGLAGIQAASGARLAVGARDAMAVRTGMPPGETSYPAVRFPAARVDRPIRDGERVTLGGVTLRAIATPGHTPGCTSWAMRWREKGRPLDIVFPCSVSVAGNRLVGNRRYPGIVSDFRRSFRLLRTLKADVVLTSHPETADVLGRARRGALVDPRLLGRIATEAETAFAADLARQQRAAR